MGMFSEIDIIMWCAVLYGKCIGIAFGVLILFVLAGGYKDDNYSHWQITGEVLLLSVGWPWFMVMAILSILPENKPNTDNIIDHIDPDI